MRASFAWNDLFRAFQSLQSGFMWRPGINSVIRIHQECWGGNITVHLYGDCEDDSELPIRCRHFMIPNCPLWDVRKIRAYFSSDDALSILQTPIQGSHVDTLIWYRRDSGIYYVRSGYSFLQRSPTPINRPSGFWKILVKLPILPKIRTSGWHATHDALPTGDHLRKANMGDGFCPFCPSVIETPLHALRDCPGAMKALRLAGFTGSNFGSSSNSVFGCLEYAATTLSRESFILLLTILWNLWNRRNGFIHNGRLQSSWIIVMNSELLLADYKNHNNPSSTSPIALQSQRQLCWHPPPEGFIKINTDGAFNQSTHEAGIGVVARNSTGEVLGVFAQYSGISIDALHKKFLVVVAGIQFAREKGWCDMHIEMDSAIVVNKFNRVGPDLSVLGSQVERYRPLLGEFNVCIINFTPKCCNYVAHTLTTHSGLSFFFGSDCPVLIRSNVLTDSHS
ncbi:hypothetical protein GQ457_17G011420 [Hibiscus cannabinus]